MAATQDRIDATFLRNLLPYLGLNFGGDVGGYTIYRSHFGRAIMYPRTFPSKPPSPLQIKQRLRFAAAQQNFMHESPQTKTLWESLTQKLSLCLTGQNLYIRMSLNPDPTALANASSRAGISLTMPPRIPA